MATLVQSASRQGRSSALYVYDLVSHLCNKTILLPQMLSDIELGLNQAGGLQCFSQLLHPPFGQGDEEYAAQGTATLIS